MVTVWSRGEPKLPKRGFYPSSIGLTFVPHGNLFTAFEVQVLLLGNFARHKHDIKANFENNSQDSIEIGREVGFSKIMAWEARRNGKENGIRHKNDARLS